MLQYYLTKSHLKNATDSYVAQPINVRSYTMEDIIQRMSQRGMSITTADIKAVLHAFEEEVVRIVADGGAINTALINTRPTIRGKFTDYQDRFDAQRHSTRTQPANGTALRDATKRIKVKKVSPPVTTFIRHIIDKTTDRRNQSLTPNAPIEIRGNKIKITDGAGAGIFFMAADGTEYPVDMIIMNQAKSIIAMTPPLPSGSYILEIRTYYRMGDDDHKSIVKARLEQLLEVA